MNVQDITGKYTDYKSSSIAGVKSKVQSDGNAPWAHGGYYERETEQEKQPVGGLRRDFRGMIAAGGKVAQTSKGNQSSGVSSIFGGYYDEEEKPKATQKAYQEPPSYMQPPITSKVQPPPASYVPLEPKGYYQDPRAQMPTSVADMNDAELEREYYRQLAMLEK